MSLCFDLSDSDKGYNEGMKEVAGREFICS